MVRPLPGCLRCGTKGPTGRYPRLKVQYNVVVYHHRSATVCKSNYTSGTGGSIYSAGCFAYINGGPNPNFPPNVPLVGRPSFFCRVDPGESPITFGSTVKFHIDDPKLDASVLGLDGSLNSYACTDGLTLTGLPTAECDTPQFTAVSSALTSGLTNVIVGNVDDLRLCVPVTENTDCNKLTSPAPSRTTVTAGRDFQLLVADDMTYAPNKGPWDGFFRKAISPPCTFSTSPDNNNGDVPPGYTDSNQQGVGPFAEFDVTVLRAATGTCTITMSEDPLFITVDFSNPTSPKGRSKQLTLTIVAPPDE